jgi:hypothetical protein
MPHRPFALSLAAVLAALLFAGCMGQRTGDASRSERATTPSREAPPAAAPAPTNPAPQPLPAEGPVVSAPGAADAPVLASAAPGSQAPAGGGAPSLAPPVPSGMLYVCARVVDGTPRHTGIDYEPKVRALCARHPEMGVCQYEREACRRDGGRVYDSRGVEITKQIEAEYDRKVMRARFRAG